MPVTIAYYFLLQTEDFINFSEEKRLLYKENYLNLGQCVLKNQFQ